MPNTDYSRTAGTRGDDQSASPTYWSGDPQSQAARGATRAETMFQRVTQRGDAPPDVDILGLPGQQLSGPVQSGDLLVRVASGEPGLGRFSEITDGELASPAEFAARGIIPEGTRPGRYAAVVEDGNDRRGAAPVARLIVDEYGYLPQKQMVVRRRSSAGATQQSDDRQRDDRPLDDRQLGDRQRDDRQLDDRQLSWGVQEPTESTSATLAEDAEVVEEIALGIAVFEAGRSVLTSGDISFEAPEVSSYIHPNTPPDRPRTRATLMMTLKAHHPRYFIDEQTFVFRIVWDYNGNDIRNARISLMRDASSSLHASTFTIAFRPTKGSDESDEQARILYVIDGRWDPVGRGDVSFTGEFRIRADGMATCVIRSERQWVYLPPDGFNYLRRLPLPTPRAEMHAFEVLFSPAGSDRINAGTERAVLDWYDRLDAELRRNVANGSIQVVLHGYASTTGDEPHNRVLARRRAERVQTILRDQLGPNARIEVVAHGERGVNTPDNTESPPNRKVRVEIRRYVQP